MAKKCNYIGQTFGYWKVIGQEGSKLKCVCKCGVTKDILANQLIRGKTTSCRECTYIKKYDNIKGRVYDNYKVISDAYKKMYGKNKHIFVSCECLLCGHIQEMPISCLIRGERGTCQACAAKMNLKKANEVNEANKYDNNIYEEKSDCWALHIGDNEVLFDKEDYDLVKPYVWRITSGYAYTGHLKDVNLTSMHHLILKKYNPNLTFDSHIQTDHINRNRFDNRKQNLRVVTVNDNLKNRGMFKNNTSGCKGVSMVNGLWRASIGCNNENYVLGNFTNFDDAVNARKDAEQNLWQYINELKSNSLFVDENGGFTN